MTFNACHSWHQHHTLVKLGINLLQERGVHFRNATRPFVLLRRIQMMRLKQCEKCFRAHKKGIFEDRWRTNKR